LLVQKEDYCPSPPPPFGKPSGERPFFSPNGPFSWRGALWEYYLLMLLPPPLFVKVIRTPPPPPSPNLIPRLPHKKKKPPPPWFRGSLFLCLVVTGFSYGGAACFLLGNVFPFPGLPCSFFCRSSFLFIKKGWLPFLLCSFLTPLEPFS